MDNIYFVKGSDLEFTIYPKAYTTKNLGGIYHETEI